MKRLLMVLLLLIPVVANAEVAITYGQDVVHATGDEFAELRYIDTSTPFFYGTDYASGWSAYVGTDETIGIEWFYPYRNWEFGLGVENSDTDTSVIGTEWKYQLRIGYLITEHWSVQLLHKSNCSSVCEQVPLMDIFPHGPDDKPNHGYNYLSASFRF